MRYNKILFFVIAIFSTFSFSHAQGLNNEHTIDTTDIQNALTMMGMHVFKFPVDPPAQECYVDFIMESYDDTVLKSSTDFLAYMKKDNLLVYAAPHTDSTRGWVRVYCYDKSPLSWYLNLNWNGVDNGLEFNEDSVTVGMSDYRAFNYKQPKIEERIPLVVRYCAKKGTRTMHCPGDLPVRD